MSRGKAKQLLNVDRIKPGPKLTRHWDSVQQGLCIAVRPNGGKSWYVVLNSQAKQSFKKIGEHPAMELPEARRIAGELRERAKASLPTLVVQDHTVEQAWRLIQTSETPYKRYAIHTRENVGILFEKWIPFKNVLVTEVQAEHWLNAIDAAQHKPGVAKAIKIFNGTFYKNLNALPQYRAQHNPLAGLRIYFAPSKSKQALTLEQVRGMSLPDPVHNGILQMLILTGQRIVSAQPHHLSA
jgi:hypothetical protein